MNITLPNGYKMRNVPEGTSQLEVMKTAVFNGLATVQDFGYDPTMSDDLPAYTPGGEKFYVGDVYRLQQEREKKVQQEQQEAERERLKQVVDKPTFMEEAHLSFDQSSNLTEDFNTILTSYFPNTTVSYSFEGDDLLPTLRLGLGPEFDNLSPDERKTVLKERKEAQIQAEHGDVLTRQQIHGANPYAQTTGMIVKGVADPATAAIPLGKTLKTQTAIGGGLGLTAGLAAQEVAGEFDPVALAAYTTVGAVLPYAVTRTGKVLERAGEFTVDRVNNAAKAVTSMVTRRPPEARSADKANKVLNEMEEEAARLVARGVKDDDVVPLIKENLKLKDADVARAIADADRPWGIPTAQEATKILSEIENPLLVKSTTQAAIDKYIQPLTASVGEIDKPLMVAMREVDRKVFERTADVTKQFSTFFNNGVRYAKQGDPNWSSLENALFNGNYKVATQIANKHFPEISSSLPDIRKTLESTFEELKELGVDVKYLEDYFPRSLKDREGLLQALGRTERSYIERAIDAERLRIGAKKLGEEAKDNYKLSAEETEQVINKVLMGFKPTPTGLKRLTAARTIEELPENLQRFYHSAPESLMMYLEKAIKETEKRRFLGVKNTKASGEEGSFDLDHFASASSMIADRLPDLPEEAKDRLIDLVNSRFEGEKNVMTKGFGRARDIQYASLLAQPAAALVQLGDVGSAAYLNGYRNVLSSLFKRELKAEDLGVINNIAAEMNNKDGFSDVLQRVFKISGFTEIDKLGKDVLVNSSLRKYRAMARSDKGRQSLEKQWGEVFGNETSELIQELQQGQITDRVKTLVYNDLADVQPISIAEMPQKYLDADNGRIFYSLKSYVIKQLNLIRERILKNIKSNPKEAFKQAVAYVATVGAANATVQTGREYVLSGFDERALENYPDAFVDTLLANVFLNRYTIDRYIERGELGTATENIISPPIFSIIDDVSRPVVQAITKEEVSQQTIDKAVGKIPVVGRVYYDFLAGGIERKQEKLDKEELEGELGGI